MVAQCFERQFAREILREQSEGVGVLEVPQDIHLPLDITAVFGEPWFKRAGERRQVERRVQRAGVEQLVEQDGILAQIVRGPAVGRRELGNGGEAVRIFEQKGEIGFAPADAFDQPEQIVGGLVAVVVRGVADELKSKIDLRFGSGWRNHVVLVA
jgi:hypothetical protein